MMDDEEDEDDGKEEDEADTDDDVEDVTPTMSFPNLSDGLKTPTYTERNFVKHEDVSTPPNGKAPNNITPNKEHNQVIDLTLDAKDADDDNEFEGAQTEKWSDIERQSKSIKVVCSANTPPTAMAELKGTKAKVFRSIGFELPYYDRVATLLNFEESIEDNLPMTYGEIHGMIHEWYTQLKGTMASSRRRVPLLQDAIYRTLYAMYELYYYYDIDPPKLLDFKDFLFDFESFASAEEYVEEILETNPVCNSPILPTFRVFNDIIVA
jgi:hypothetical protein